jgi:ribosomal protein L16 Arg81 hydroxylase
MTFQDVVAPLAVEEFLSSYMGRQYWRTRSQAGRFASLLPWNTVNDTLTALRIVGNRVRVVKGGEEIEQKRFTTPVTSDRGAYLNAEALTALLVGGATLVVNQVDELVPGLRELAESCEDVVRTNVAINMYAGWKREHGFNLHWDEHDTMILQIAGRKKWTVYEPTRLHPVLKERTEASKPTGTPVWDGILEDGDLLYMPRGWWHVAVPLDEPSLHLTLGIHHKNGVDMLRWLAQEMAEELEARMDVPHWQTSDEQRAWIDALRAKLHTRLTVGTIDAFVKAMDTGTQTRPRMYLPHAVKDKTVNVTATTPLRVTSKSRLYIDVSAEGRASFHAAQGTWCCDAGLVPALGMLRHNRATTLQEMKAATESGKASLLEPFVKALVLADVLWAEQKAATANLEAATVAGGVGQ